MGKRKAAGTANPRLSKQDAFTKIQILQEKYGCEAQNLALANEAKTRLEVIDTVLEYLGWSRDEFNPEHSAGSTGFIDYLITADGIPRFIVEAKRIGHTFQQAHGRMRKAEYKLSSIKSLFGSSVSEVIDQATGYSLHTGIPYAVITNGTEWMLFQAIPYGNQSIENLHCFYFGNIFTDQFNFELFWELLAKENVIDGQLEQNFSQFNTLPTDFVGISSKKLPELHWNPNSADKYLREFYKNFFNEIINPECRKMLQYCFVGNTRLDQYEGELKRVLKDTAPKYISDAEEITPDETEKLLVSGTGMRRGHVVLITGSVGAGKSTLVNKVILEAKLENRGLNLTNQSKDREEPSLICLILDLINEVSGNLDAFSDRLWHEIYRKWEEENPESLHYENLKKIFGRELSIERSKINPALSSDEKHWLLVEDAKLRELSGDPQNFIRGSWKYFTQKKSKGIVVFLDNIDQASDDYQEIVYAFAHKLADMTGATIIITMREVTYFRGRDSGFLDIRSGDTVFHLQAPDLVQVLSKRIQYIEDIDTVEDYRMRDWKRNLDWTEFRGSSQKYSRVLKSTFLVSENCRKNLEFLAAVSWHNVRYFLDCLRRLHMMIGSDPETWTLEEIIAALMLPGNTMENQSTLARLYYPPFESYPCYFIKVRVLLMLMYGTQSFQERQGISLSAILTFSRMYSYQDRWTKRAVQDMVHERLLECTEVPVALEYTKDYLIQENHSFRVSPLAVVLLEKIQFETTYLSILGNDMPFHQKDVFSTFVDTVKDVFDLLSEDSLTRHTVNLLAETDSAKIVVKYLVSSFKNEPPLGRSIMHISEIETVENRLNDILKRLCEVVCLPSNTDFSVGVERRSRKNSRQEKQAEVRQLTFLENDRSDSSDGYDIHDARISIPEKLKHITKENERISPMIFWALAELRSRGQKVTTGAEITRMINQHLADDHSKVEPTNISRKLRSSPMRLNNSWLEVHERRQNKTLYGLANSWQRSWEILFEEEAPITD